MIFERLDALEAKVKDTVAELAHLRGVRDTVEARLRAAEAELAERNRELSGLRAEQQEVLGRVESLLGAIDETASSPTEPLPAQRRGDNGQSRPTRI